MEKIEIDLGEHSASYSLDDHGQIHGPYQEYNKDGKLIKEGNYKHGKEHGEWIYYSSAGEETVLNFNEGCLLLGGVAWPVVRPELTTEES